MSLNEYTRKRDMSRTPEPDANSSVHSQPGLRRFTVQKHAARNLHYDLRLELDGVLKSWAVPRGPSLDPKVKRLAIEVEDHPLSYAEFEGVIPAGQYGAGQVIVWDSGSWEPEEPPELALQRGKLKFQLRGTRLHGGWMLIRSRRSGNQPQWLLSKIDDDFASRQIDIVEQYQTSVLTGQSLGTAAELPSFVPPKLPSLVDRPPGGAEWLHELKLDGYRMQAHWSTSGLRLLTRSGLDWTSQFSAVAVHLAKLELAGTILDGELVALDDEGRSDFSRLRSADGGPQAIAYFAFDLLYFRGQDLRTLPLLERKRRLKALIAAQTRAHPSCRLQFLDHVDGSVDTLLAHCQRLGLEGIVSKRVDRPYTSGRATDWVKTKLRYRESLVVGGYETGQGNQGLSSLLLGYYGEDGTLQFAGRVGTGWHAQLAESLIERMRQQKAGRTPFAQPVPPPLRSAQRKLQTTWLRPVLVADVQFAGWTSKLQLRQASFQGLNSSLSATQIQSQSLFADRQAPHTAKEPQAMTNQDKAAKDKSLSAQPPRRRAVSLPGLTHRDRVLFPDDGFTKEDVAEYLFRVTQWLLPHVIDRPLTLLRCPEGIAGQQYYQRHPQKGFPDAITSLTVASEAKPLLCLRSPDALLATAQISAIELHPWGCRRDQLEKPDRVTIDLDPDPQLPWSAVVEGAFLVRNELDNRKLTSFVKTTGGKGLHVVIPIARRHSWDSVFAFAKSLAEQLQQSHPELFVAKMTKAARVGRVYIDYHRNHRSSTAVGAYSLRARAGATVSTPLFWDELHDVEPAALNLRSVPDRLANLHSDPWSDMTSLKQSLKLR